jgi:hypothetical protein
MGMFPALFPFFFLAGVCGSAQTVMPLEFSLHVPTAQVMVAGRPATMVIDTAASITVLDSTFADGIAVAGKSVKVKGAGREANARRLDRIRLSHEAEHGVDVPAIAISLELLSGQMGRRIDGIIGAQFLERYVVEFDYQRKVASLHESNGFKPPADWRWVPIRLVEGRPMVEGLLIGAGSQTYKGDFLLDTGSNYGVTLLPVFAERHMLPPKGSPILEDPSLGIAGPSPAVVFAMGGFQLGELRFSRPYVRARQGGRGENGGLIGGALLRQLRFAIDYPGKRLYYGQSVEFGRPFTLELAGMRVSWYGADYSQARVTEVLPGRAGAKAGLRAGDEIVEPRLNANQLAEHLHKPNSTVSLVVKRGGQTLRLELQLEPLLGGEN